MYGSWLGFVLYFFKIPSAWLFDKISCFGWYVWLV